MKVPKKMKKYCKKCNSYQEMTVTITKQGGRGKTHPMSRGSKARIRKRGDNRGFGNQGKYSRKPIASWKRTGAKKSKSLNLTLRCKKCGKARIMHGRRLKKVEVLDR